MKQSEICDSMDEEQRQHLAMALVLLSDWKRKYVDPKKASLYVEKIADALGIGLYFHWFMMMKSFGVEITDEDDGSKIEKMGMHL